ncbi:MAG: hypothetical protein IKQ97_04630 [Eubacterium sp.]|nr:hypothetical protein [Eubacterium sp.]
MRHIRKIISILLLAALMLSLFPAGRVSCASKVDSVKPDKDGWYGVNYIEHDGTLVTADGDRSVLPYDRNEYLKTRIESGEIYAGLKDDTVYYVKAEQSTGTAAGSAYVGHYQFIERNVRSGTEKTVYEVNAADTDFYTYRQGDVIYLIEQTTVSSGGSSASEFHEPTNEISVKIQGYDLATEQVSPYATYKLEKATGHREVKFFATGDGGLGYLEHSLTDSTGSLHETGSAVMTPHNRIVLIDKNGKQTSEKKLADGTLDLIGYGDRGTIVTFDEKTGNLYYKGKGESVGNSLMIATIRDGQILIPNTTVTQGSGVTVDLGIEARYAGIVGGSHLVLSRDYWDYTQGIGGVETFVLDASKLSYDKPVPRSTATPKLGSSGPEPVVYPINKPRSVQSVTLSNREEATEFVMLTRGNETADRKLPTESNNAYSSEVSGRGLRVDYCKKRDSMLFNTGLYEITEVSVKEKKVIAKYRTTHPVWTLMVCGDRLVCMEREGTMGNTFAGYDGGLTDYYNSVPAAQRSTDGDPTERFFFETIDMSPASAFSITGGEAAKATTTLTAGGSADYVAVFPTAMKSVAYFTSSDPSVLSVTKDGKAAAWSEGTATITAARADGGGTQTMKVSVKPRDRGKAQCIELKEKTNEDTIGNRCNNMEFKDIQSWLYELDDGRLLRFGVIHKKDSEDDPFGIDHLHVWYYTADGVLSEEKELQLELPIFGGFFKGKDAFYIVCGQECPEKTSDPTASEVIRVIKYDFSWNRLGACSFDRELIDTKVPFSGGCVKFAETDDGYLCIHTTKQMARMIDEKYHQGNLVLMIEEATMKGYNTPKKSKLGTPFIDGYLDESLAWISHCFGEYIRVKGRRIYLSGLSDANIPSDRGNRYCEVRMDAEAGNSTSTRYDADLQVRLHGALGNTNPTGMNVGGFELTSAGALSVGNVLREGWPKDMEFLDDEHRDVYVAFQDHQMMQHRYRYLTEYDTEKGDIITWCPYLVKVDDRHFLMMWMENDWVPMEEFSWEWQERREKRKLWTKLQLVDCEGNPIGPCVKKNIVLSDCEPVLRKDGRISWVAEDGVGRAVLYTIDPYDLKGIKDDVDYSYYNKLAYSDGKKPDSGSDDEDLSDITIIRGEDLTFTFRKGGAVLNGNNWLKDRKKVHIPKSIRYEGKTYPVIGIAKSAFRYQRKLKKIYIQTTSITSIGKYAFDRIAEKPVFYLPKKKYKKYTALLKKKKTGYTGKWKFKKR